MKSQKPPWILPKSPTVQLSLVFKLLLPYKRLYLSSAATPAVLLHSPCCSPKSFAITVCLIWTLLWLCLVLFCFLVTSHCSESKTKPTASVDGPASFSDSTFHLWHQLPMCQVLRSWHNLPFFFFSSYQYKLIFHLLPSLSPYLHSSDLTINVNFSCKVSLSLFFLSSLLKFYILPSHH